MSKQRVDVFYDVVSPYSWLGFEVLCRYREQWNIDLNFRPLYLGGVMKGAENQPPGLNAFKARYMQEDIKRAVEIYGIPLKMPKNFEKVMFGGTINAMRMLTALNYQHPDKVEAASRELWMRLWSRGQSISEPNDLTDALKAVGLSEQQAFLVIEHVTDPNVKQSMKMTTDEAVKLGAFGAPWIVVHTAKGPQSVFGSDRFETVAHLLGKTYDGPFPNRDRAKYSLLKAKL